MSLRATVVFSGLLSAAVAMQAHVRSDAIVAKQKKMRSSGLGHPQCPCVGITGAKGSVNVTIDATLVAYPSDLGTRCEAWDDATYLSKCEAGGEPGKGNDWCAQKWCYVDPCNCESGSPKKASYSLDATYKGKPLYYSYETCDSEDSYTAALAVADEGPRKNKKAEKKKGSKAAPKSSPHKKERASEEQGEPVDNVEEPEQAQEPEQAEQPEQHDKPKEQKQPVQDRPDEVEQPDDQPDQTQQPQEAQQPKSSDASSSRTPSTTGKHHQKASKEAHDQSADASVVSQTNQKKKDEHKATQNKVQDHDAAKADESTNWKTKKAGNVGQKKHEAKHEAKHENEADKDWNVDKKDVGSAKESSSSDGKQGAGHNSGESETTEKWNAAQHDISHDTKKQAKQVDAKKTKSDSKKASNDDSKKASKGETKAASHAKDPITWAEDEIKEKIEEVKKVVEDAVPLDADMNATDSKARVEQGATEASTVGRDIARKASKKKSGGKAEEGGEVEKEAEAVETSDSETEKDVEEVENEENNAEHKDDDTESSNDNGVLRRVAGTDETEEDFGAMCSESFVEKVAGKKGCMCVGFANQVGSLEVGISGSKVVYPADVGGSCTAWDQDVHPECISDGENAVPDWCQEAWCYVDPCSCDQKAVRADKKNGYLQKATAGGKPLFYSYKACGSVDHWTATNNDGACSNKHSEDECTGDCSWEGKACKDQALAQFCEVVEQSGAEACQSSAALMVGMVLMFFSVALP